MAAFERLYLAHAARVHGLARRMVGADEADELTQDVFVRAWEKLGTFRGEAAFGTWLHRLAVNVLLGHRRARDRRNERFWTDEETVAGAGARPAEPAVTVDLEAAMARLPGGARRVFVLHDVEGYKHGEIADMLGVTEGTSKSQLHRARMLVREHLNR
ncbi:MAG TPA: RNA polymerase sigma factor [Gemmatimonadota bacterium]|nr:RNA polymerase sigma factor [Gemmatimonadota bacterium]